MLEFFIAVSLLLCLALAVVLQRQFASPHVPLSAHVTIFLSYTVTFVALFTILPVDLLTASPQNSTLHALWNTVYWTSFVLTWLVVPVQMEYYVTGGFSFEERLKASLRANLRFYLVVLALFVVFLVYVAIRDRLGGRELLGFAVCLSNVWGLTLCVVLLGYGLVEVPRWFWHRSDAEWNQRRTFLDAAGAFEDVEDAKDQMADAVRLFRELSARNPGDQREISIIEAQLVAVDLPAEEDRRVLQYERRAEPDDYDGDWARVNAHIKDSLRRLDVATSHWEDLIEDADREVPTHYRTVHQAIACVLAPLSLLVLWSEMTMPSTCTNLSAVSKFPRGLDVIVIGYMSACVFFGLWKLRLFELYHMRANKRTHEYSLLFNAAFVQRVLAPLAFNYVRVVRVDDTAFEEVIGKMDVVPFFGEDFNVWFPLLIVVVALLVAANAFGKAIEFIGGGNFGAADGDDDMVQEGRMLLRKEIRRRDHRQQLPHDQDAVLPMVDL